MYLSHYNLNVKPFQISPDPKFLWLSKAHKEALSVLKHGISTNSGILLLAGDVGTGKTILINTLLNSLDEDTIVATIINPGLGVLDFYNLLSNILKIGGKYQSKGDFLVRFIYFLHQAQAKHKKILLIIDEAQKLSHEMLDELRLLSNLKKNDAKLLDIVLSGQNELNETLSEPQNRAVLQRITTKYTIEPLKKVEVTYYIEFRLSVAGSKKNIFNSDAIQKIILFSKCYPRLINIICDNALLAGYMAKLKIIDGSIIQECANNLQLSELSAEKEQNENEVFGSGSNARFKPTCNTSF